MEDCVFCEIAKGSIPANTVYEDNDVIAFLDIHPVTMGHTLVIPKKHYLDTFDIPVEILSQINRVAKELGTQYLTALNCDGANFLNASRKEAQQSVFHYHMHIVPRYKDENLNFWFHQAALKPTQVELQEILKKIKQNT